jgi:hypothetical protein
MLRVLLTILLSALGERLRFEVPGRRGVFMHGEGLPEARSFVKPARGISRRLLGRPEEVAFRGQAPLQFRADL